MSRTEAILEVLRTLLDRVPGAFVERNSVLFMERETIYGS